MEGKQNQQWHTLSNREIKRISIGMSRKKRFKKANGNGKERCFDEASQWQQRGSKRETSEKGKKR